MSKNKQWKQQQPKARPPVDEPAIVIEPALDEVSKVDFDAWYAMRANAIPRHHHKEIIKADFKARGLGQCESLNNFDDALRKYGVKLS